MLLDSMPSCFGVHSQYTAPPLSVVVAGSDLVIPLALVKVMVQVAPTVVVQFENICVFTVALCILTKFPAGVAIDEVDDELTP